MFHALKKNWIKIILGFFISAYIAYFSYFSVLRYKTLYASYYDLGIMHQTVYNTYMAIKNRDPGRVLELTNPQGPDQIKRMAIHNDIFLAFFAPFYFIYPGPETLLVIQAFALGLGGLLVFLLTQVVLRKLSIERRDIMSFVMAFSYLVYSPLAHVNIFDFHPVAFSIPLILGMFYFWLSKKYTASFIFFILSLITKEQVALTTLFFGFYAFIRLPERKGKHFAEAVIIVSIFWFVAAVYYIIPRFKGGMHFAITYYGEFGDTPSQIFFGLLKNPLGIFRYLFRADTFSYFGELLGPVMFLPVISLVQLLITLPEFAINLLSNNVSMRSTFFHYTALIIPFVFISTIYGIKKIEEIKLKKFIFVKKTLPVLLMGFSLFFSYLNGPLPGSRRPELHPFLFPQQEMREVVLWAGVLKDENLKISSTGQLAPYFTSRRYFYNFSTYYYLADYLVIRPHEIYNYPEKDQLVPVYEKLKNDKRFMKIYEGSNFEVYRKT